MEMLPPIKVWLKHIPPPWQSVSNPLPNGTFSSEDKQISAELGEQNFKRGVALKLTESPANGFIQGQVNWAYQSDTMSGSDMGSQYDDSITQASKDSHDKKEPTDPHSIILDLSTTSFVDTVAVKTLRNVLMCHMEQLLLDLFFKFIF